MTKNDVASILSPAVEHHVMVWTRDENVPLVIRTVMRRTKWLDVVRFGVPTVGKTNSLTTDLACIAIPAPCLCCEEGIAKADSAYYCSGFRHLDASLTGTSGLHIEFSVPQVKAVFSATGNP